MLTVPYTQKARVNASSGIRSGSKLWRMDHFRDVTKMVWRVVPGLNRRRTSQKGALPTELTTRIAGLRCQRPLYSQKTVYGRPEGTLTLTLCVGERVAVPAACRLFNVKNHT